MGAKEKEGDWWHKGGVLIEKRGGEGGNLFKRVQGIDKYGIDKDKEATNK